MSGVNWIACEDESPDDEIVVMVALDDDCEPVWLGYHDSNTGGWYNTDQMRFGCRVTHWAELPEGAVNATNIR